MQGARFRLGGMGGKAGVGLLARALMFRVLIPVGWMPTTGSGFAITLCTGMGAVTAWVEKDGHTHKEKPAQESTGHTCTFSGFSAALALPDLGAAVVDPRPVQTALTITRTAPVQRKNVGKET